MKMRPVDTPPTVGMWTIYWEDGVPRYAGKIVSVEKRGIHQRVSILNYSARKLPTGRRPIVTVEWDRVCGTVYPVEDFLDACRYLATDEPDFETQRVIAARAAERISDGASAQGSPAPVAHES